MANWALHQRGAARRREIVVSVGVGIAKPFKLNQMINMITFKIIALVLFSAIAQAVGVCLLPLTKGLTNLWPTVATVVCFFVGLAVMSRLIYFGVNLSALVPLVATIVPLSSVLIGVLMFGDAASWPRISMLVTACVIIGAASYF